MPSKITVIVPVRNEAKCVEQTLRGLLTQRFPLDRYEVIVADGGSTDSTVAIVRRLQAEYANLRLLFNPRRLSSAARNVAVRHMTGDYAIIVDGHCHIADPDYLQKLADAFETSHADTLGRPQPLEVPNPTTFQRAVAIARQSRLGHNPDSDIFSDQARFIPPQNTAVAYSRHVFETVGLFDQSFDACEDVEFNQRVHQAGLSCYFVPSLKVVYEPRSAWRALFYQLGRYGSGRVRLAVKHPRSLTLPALVPPFWLLWLVFGLLACIVYPPATWLYGGSILLYLMMLLGGAAWLGRREPIRMSARIPAVIVGIHFGFAWGFWKEVGKQFMKGLGERPASAVRLGERPASAGRCGF